MIGNYSKNKYNKGVTLIELLVVISIFMVISSITIFSYGKFNSSLSIQNLADDIALSIRRAQGYAIGVRGENNLFDFSYGIHLTLRSNPSNIYAGSNKSFILFADIDNDNVYQYNNTCGVPSSSNECLELLNITTADKILGIYLNGNSASIAENSFVDILFKRPNPEPTFFCKNSSGGNCISSPISSVSIRISTDASPDEIYKIITISNNGQINVSSSQ